MGYQNHNQSYHSIHTYSKELADVFKRMASELDDLHTNSAYKGQDEIGKMLYLSEAEKQRFSDELYHDVAQSIYSLLIRINMMKRSIPDEKMKASLLEIQQVMDQILNKIKNISFEMFPLMLKDLGFLATLRSLIRKLNDEYQTEISLDVKGSLQIREELETFLYQVCYDTLQTFVLKSNVKKCSLGIEFKEKIIELVFSMDEPAALKDEWHEELFLVRKRVEYWKGEFELNTTDGSYGISIVVKVRPLD